MEYFIQWVVGNSVKGGIMTVLVFCVLFFFSKQISPRWKCLLCMLVVLRLVMPAILPAQFSIFNLSGVTHLGAETHKSALGVSGNPANFANTVKVSAYPQEKMRPRAVPATNGTRISSAVEYFKSLSIWQIAFVVWAVGTVILGSIVLYRNFRFSSCISRLRPLTDPRLLGLMEDCRRELGITTPVAIVSTGLVSSPALMGFLRPRLLLPEKMEENCRLTACVMSSCMNSRTSGGMM